jgi:imidazolonepropionase-like amidohydrolase/Tol biopolymer transport system component
MLVPLASCLPASAASTPAPADGSDWKVDDPRGSVHPVPIDVDEGTWMSVTVHGDTVVFDLLGDLWSLPLAGGEATRLTSGPSWDGQPAFSPDGKRIAFVSDRGGNENVWLMNADGSGLEAFTDEEDARCTEPVWDDAGPWLLYRRRTVDTRSIGVTELWQKHLEGGDGFALTSKDEHPHAAEAWVQGPYVWFASRHGRFEYDQSAVQGLWDVQRLDRRTNVVRPMAWGPGSASHPIVSADGRTLWFVSRDRAATLLERMDLATGERTVVDRELSPDELEAFALHGTYPRFDLAPDGDLVGWSGGGLWRWDAATGARSPIPFHAAGELRMRDVERWPLAIPDRVQAKVIRWPTLSPRGDWAFSALGALWVRTADGRITRRSEGTGYAPAWSPDGKVLAWTSWDDDEGGRLHLTGAGGRTETLPLEGQLTNPAWAPDGESLVVLRAGGGSESPDLATQAWYEVVLLERAKKGWTARTVTTLDAPGTSRNPRLHLRGGRLLLVDWRVEDPRAPAQAVLVSMALDGTDRRDHLKLGEAEEVAVSPDGAWVAYKLDHQLHVAALPPFAREVEASAVPDERVTAIVGDWLSFTPDGSAVTWVEGPTIKQLPLSALWQDPPESNGGTDAPEESDPFAEHEGVVSLPLDLTVPRARPEGVVVLAHARVIPMTGDTVLEDVNVVIERDRIVEIGPGATRPGAVVRDVTGKTVIPGLVDVHAHLHFSSADILPEQEWRYLTALDFGVTTVHDPSTITDLSFTQAERVEAGFEKGPRVYSTGAVLYGALSADGAKTPDPDAAVAHVRRLELVGAHSVKVYQQSQRERRQWYVEACRAEQVLCVPEGGGDTWQDLGMVVDGFHAVEHALPETPLYADVRQLWAGSTKGGDGFGTFYTPTLQVAYGGLSGKWYEFQRANPLDDERLRRHTPHRLLDGQAWRLPLLAQDDDWRFRSTAADAARMAREGVHVTLGAHGELQGLGAHWELWALGSPGAMTPLEALRAGTIEGARYLGLDRELGTVEVGKLADLVILDADPLADLRATTRIHAVLKNGEWFE